MENIFILVPLSGQVDVSKQYLDVLYDYTTKEMERLLGVSFRGDVIVKETFTPQRFESEYHSFKGSAFGPAHTLFQSLMFRFKNRSKKVKTLDHTGQYVNPGTGVPLAVASGVVTTNIIEKYEERSI